MIWNKIPQLECLKIKIQIKIIETLAYMFVQCQVTYHNQTVSYEISTVVVESQSSPVFNLTFKWIKQIEAIEIRRLVDFKLDVELFPLYVRADLWELCYV